MKKTFSLFLAVVLGFCLSVTAFAAAPKLGKQTRELPVVTSAFSGTIDPTSDLDDVRPGDKFYIGLSNICFENPAGATGAPINVQINAITLSDLRRNKTTVRYRIKSGSKAIENVGFSIQTVLGVKSAFIEVKFVEPFVSVSDLDFDFTIYLLIDGDRMDNAGYGIQFTGTLSNETTYVDSSEDYVDLYNGQIAEAEGYIKTLRCDLGEGVLATLSAYKGSKHYGVAEIGGDEQDEEILKKYPDIGQVVTLKTINMSKAKIEFKDFGKDYYVYDKNLKYVGKSNDTFDYSDKYYFATAQLDVEDEEEA